jgi:AraC-like DNA-binding protein
MKIVFEKIVPKAGSSFAILDKRAPAFDGRFHFHPELEITLIERSTGRRVVGDSVESFQPGDLVLLGQNLPHQYVSSTTTSSSAPDAARAKVMQFRSDLLGDTWLELPEFKRIDFMLSRAARGLKFSPKTTERAAQLIARLFATSETTRLIMLLELLDVLSCDDAAAPIASAGYVSKINMREGDAIDSALQFLNSNFAQPVTLDELSRYLHVSAATCNRLLQKSIGRSFKTALIEIRISHACRQLLETSQSIVQIAYASGFTNLSNFNRRFKELKGISPKAYRNLMKTTGRELAPV